MSRQEDDDLAMNGVIKFIMRNKNITISSHCTPSSTRYRRTRYKTSIADTSTVYKTINVQLRHINTEASETPYIARKKYQASVSATKKHKTEVSTDAVTSFREAPRKQSYLEGWNAMLQSKINETKTRKNIAQLRVCLPSLSQNADSQFTMLDPVALPIEFIQREIQKVSEELPITCKEVKEIKAELTSIKGRVESDLQQISTYGSKGFLRLKNMLINDRVQSQQHIMRARRLVKEACSECQKLKEQVQALKCPVGSLQEVLFKGRPFDLQFDPELQSDVPSSYF